MRVVGIDPGSANGVSLIVDREISDEKVVYSLNELWDAICEMKPDLLVVEDYLGHRRMASNFKKPISAIGVCELYSQRFGVELKMSNPSKLQGKVKPRGLSPHIWSARVHALAYVRSHDS